jgi:hypothetical protein
LAELTPSKPAVRIGVPIALLLVIALIDLAAMPGEFWGGDPTAWREETRSIILSGQLNVPVEFAERYGEPGQFYVKHPVSGLYYAKFGLVNSLMSLPPMWVQKVFDVRPGGAAATTQTIALRGYRPSLLLFNLWNILLSLALAALLYVVAGWYTRRLVTRAFFVLACLYCTAFAYYQRAQSSEIYQAVFFTACFIALMSFLRTWAASWLLLTWLCVGLLVFTRLTYALLVPLVIGLALYEVLRDRTRPGWPQVPARIAIGLLLPPVVIFALLGYVNHVKFGSPWASGYHVWKPETHLPVGRWQDGVWGLLFAARFSIFLYFPLLIFALIGLPRFVRARRLDAIVIFAIFIVFLVVVGMIPTWAGEWTYGPRYVLFMLPVLSLPLVTFVDELILDRLNTWPARAWGIVLLICLGYSTYLGVQVNRLPFWSYYREKIALDVAWTDTSAAYFRDHHVGVVADDLLRHRNDLDDLPFMAEMKKRVPPQFFEDYRNALSEMLRTGNWYWSLPADQRG